MAITVDEFDNLFLSVERLRIVTVAEMQGTIEDRRNEIKTSQPTTIGRTLTHNDAYFVDRSSQIHTSQAPKRI